MRPARILLESPQLPHWLERVGLRPEDAADARTALTQVLEQPDQLALVEAAAEALRAGIGRFPGEAGGETEQWPGYDPVTDPYGMGVLPLFALVATAPDLVEFHRARGIEDAVSARTLTDLGQQAWVHRRTYGGFGLHTYGWMPVAWSGSLHWLGRLQFNLERLEEGWVCSTHIPQTGPLEPAAVDDSFRQAAAFFARHFPDRPVTDFWCHSWLLDPELAAALDPGSNLARFQRRWHLYGEPMPGDADALFFTFARRGEVDLESLPQETSLQRALVERLRSGRHWSVRSGRIALTEVVPA